MKLSEKGHKKLSQKRKELESGLVKFEPNDFQGAVVLTVEEAKRVQSALYELLRNSNDKNSREWLTYWMVNGRIKQAENSND